MSNETRKFTAELPEELFMQYNELPWGTKKQLVIKMLEALAPYTHDYRVLGAILDPNTRIKLEFHDQQFQRKDEVWIKVNKDAIKKGEGDG